MSADILDIDVTLGYPSFSLNVTQQIPLSGCTAILGPNGGGKSTLLRLIAGLARPDAGRISFRGQLWCDLSQGIDIKAHQRRVGIVFQDSRLFPHLSVEGNLLYADKRSGIDGISRDHNKFDITDIIAAFDLKALLARAPASLSGGERQRVAIARTLLTRPDLLLLDEPLSAFDRHRKAEILPYLDGLADRFDAPVIYVSHSIAEIVRLAEQTIILKDGRIDTIGPTARVLNAYGAGDDEIGVPAAVVEGEVVRHDEAHYLTYVALGESVVALPVNSSKRIGETVAIRIDPRNVALALTPPQDISIRNIIKATILDWRDRAQSPFVDVVLKGDKAVLRAQITRAAFAELSLEKGLRVFTLVKSASFD